ncbi:Podocalyxin, partial [Buceros rhinoceros silvestris]
SLGLSSQDSATTTISSSVTNGPTTTPRATSTVERTASPSSPGTSPSTSAKSPATVQVTTSASKPVSSPPTPETSPTTVQVTTPTSKLPNAPSTPETTPTTVKVTTSTTPGNTQPAHTTSVHPSQQVSSSASSGASPAASAASPAAPAATSRAAQRATSPAASLGSSAATTATSPVLTHKSSTSTTSQDSVSAVTSPSNVEAQRSHVSAWFLVSAGNPDHRSPGAGSVPTKPASADQSPASTQPAAPAPGEQPASSSPGRQHHHASFQNEILCEDQQQNTQPTIYLREAKTCDEWRAASANTSFYENFCSTGQHAFNASRGTCTVTFSSSERRSKHWAVRVVVHLPLDPKEVFEMLKEKDKLEELGIANTTYDKMESEMIINDEFSTPLIITIVTLAGSLLLIAAIYGCCHQRFSQKKDQQRLTEELQTMENGYHDNPTLEVMETSSEMQEKKVNLNGELGDSWIVPLDTLMKEDLEEEDTHL